MAFDNPKNFGNVKGITEIQKKKQILIIFLHISNCHFTPKIAQKLLEMFGIDLLEKDSTIWLEENYQKFYALEENYKSDINYKSPRKLDLEDIPRLLKNYSQISNTLG